MKTLFLLFALLAAPVMLLADGTSGDYLRSPENSETATKQFGSSTDTYDRGGWYCTGSRGYARKEGVALRTNAAGALCYDFPEGATPETICHLAIVCRTATKGSVGQTHTLEVAFAGAERTEQCVFETTSATDAVTLSLTFETPVVASGLIFQNPGDKLFEIASVTWQSVLPEMEVDLGYASTVVVGDTFPVSVNAISGGSGTYPYAAVTFNGQTFPIDTLSLPQSVSFTAPNVSGEIPLECVVRDSTGREKRFSCMIDVNAYAVPFELTATAITRERFTLEWKLHSGATPESYTINVSHNPRKLTVEALIQPEWVLEDDGYYYASEPIDCSQWSGDFPITSLTIAAPEGASCGSLALRAEGSAAYSNKPFLGSSYLCGKISDPQVPRYLRLKTAALPRYLRLTMVILRDIASVSVEASGQRRLAELEDLPASTALSVTVTAHYADGVRSVSAPLLVETLPLPGFTEVIHYPKWNQLQLQWPESEPDLEGELRFYATRTVENLTPPGLYLTRLLWTKSGGGLTTSKAIALTNLSNRPLHLDGTSVLSAVKRDTGTQRLWDFSVKDETGETTYPYVIAPGEELIIAHASYLPFDLREGVVQSTASALNFTADWDLSLYCGETLQNTLTPQTNACVRLAEDSLEALEVSPIDTTTPSLDQLYAPWTKLEETHLLATHTLTRTTATSSMLNYAAFRTITPTTRKIYVECRTRQGQSFSKAATLLLWEVPLLHGTYFLLR